ncbi:MAG: hypothetical protein ACE5E5_16640 [Phycisphaerae bacterium]
MAVSRKEHVALFHSQLIPLVKRSDIYLPRIGDGDEERFAVNFRKTWRRLGKDVRGRLTAYWRDPDLVYMALQPVFPTIEVLNDWPERCERDLARCCKNGHHFRFWAPAVDAMPDHLVQTLIAHELAHAYRASDGTFVMDPQNLPTADEDRNDEFETMRLVCYEWGFDDTELDDWATSYMGDVLSDYEERMDC